MQWAPVFDLLGHPPCTTYEEKFFSTRNSFQTNSSHTVWGQPYKSKRVAHWMCCSAKIILNWYYMSARNLHCINITYIVYRTHIEVILHDQRGTYITIPTAYTARILKWYCMTSEEPTLPYLQRIPHAYWSDTAWPARSLHYHTYIVHHTHIEVILHDQRGTYITIPTLYTARILNWYCMTSEEPTLPYLHGIPHAYWIDTAWPARSLHYHTYIVYRTHRP